MNIGARAGTEDDVRTLVELYRACRQALAGERGGSVHVLKEAFAEPLEPHFRAMVRDDRRLVLLGTIDDVAVGLGVARLEEVPEAAPLVTVEVLYVDPPAREVGVGETLLAEVTDWASRRGAAGIDVPVLPGMRNSKNFLEGAGFAARLLVMHRRLAS
ncbi:MAG: N-acetyltransferase family protein [Acidimicrobiales bacterium]|jgi:GNAT superfamily N-acetyltransferase